MSESVWREHKLEGDDGCGARSGHAALFCASQNCVFVFGGHNETALDDMWKYHIGERRWEQVEVTQPNPLPRVMFTAAIVNDDIFLFGGVHEDGIYNDLWKFDTLRGRWECLFEEAPAPERCNHAMTITRDGQMVIHGGECIEKLSDGWIFDSQAMTWTPLLPQRSKKQKQKDKKRQVGASSRGPGARVGHTLAYIAETDSLMLFGGLSAGLDGMVESMNDVWIMPMAVEPRAWKEVQLQGLAPSPRSRPASVCINASTLLVLGGFGLKENTGEDGDDDDDDDNLSRESEGDEEPNEAQGTIVVDEAEDEPFVASDHLPEEAATESTVREVKDEEHVAESEAQDQDERDDEEGDCEEKEAAESEYEDIVEDFLDDAWLVRGSDYKSVDLNYHSLKRFAYIGPARHGLSATLCGDAVMIFGGFDGKDYCDRIDLADVSELGNTALYLKAYVHVNTLTHESRALWLTATEHALRIESADVVSNDESKA